jgi:hypothetical protein
MNMTPDPTQAGQSAFIFIFFLSGRLPCGSRIRDASRDAGCPQNTRARKAERRSTNRIFAPERICPRHSLVEYEPASQKKSHGHFKREHWPWTKHANPGFIGLPLPFIPTAAPCQV